MIWLTWRQFRAQALAGLAVLAAAAIYFLVTGLHMHHTYTADLASCTPLNNCDGVFNDFENYYRTPFQLNQLLVIAVPALIGIFWGAPLIGRELETGTHQIVWNQTVTRTRWLAVKLTVVGLASIATAGILSYLMTWWAGPLDHLTGNPFMPMGNRFAAMTFASRDIVPFGYAAFALALGAAVGLLLRRTVPAMAVTLAVFIGIQILVPAAIRPNLLSSTTVTFPINQSTTSQANGIYGNGDGSDSFYLSGLNVPQDAWVLSTSPVEDSSGRPVGMDTAQHCLPPPGPGNGVNPFEQFGACVASDNLHESVTYQPGSHYWLLQWYETGIFLALAAALSGLCFWQIRRRQN